MKKWLKPGISFVKKEVELELHQTCLKSERKAHKATVAPCLAQNIGRLSALVGMSAPDCRILEFVVSMHNENLLREAADSLGELSTTQVFHVLATALDIPEQEIRASFSPQGVLARSNIITGDNRNYCLSYKLDLLSDKFADNIYSSDSDPIDLIRDRVKPASPAQLAPVDFEHIAPSLAVLRPYLRNALASSRQGVNIFLHGKPGTGKSQLAKMLAQDLGH